MFGQTTFVEDAKKRRANNCFILTFPSTVLFLLKSLQTIRKQKALTIRISNEFINIFSRKVQFISTEIIKVYWFQFFISYELYNKGKCWKIVQWITCTGLWYYINRVQVIIVSFKFLVQVEKPYFCLRFLYGFPADVLEIHVRDKGVKVVLQSLQKIQKDLK